MRRHQLNNIRHAQRKGFDSIELRTDSLFVINSMTKFIWSWIDQDSNDGIWRTQQGTPVKHQSIWEEIHEIRDDIQMNFRFVRGHQGEKGNQEADKLGKIVKTLFFYKNIFRSCSSGGSCQESLRA
jgi:ribonuclease HI